MYGRGRTADIENWKALYFEKCTLTHNTERDSTYLHTYVPGPIVSHPQYPHPHLQTRAFYSQFTQFMHVKEADSPPMPSLDVATATNPIFIPSKPTKILVSPGHGAGWVSWAPRSASDAFLTWMLTYEPLVTALEKTPHDKGRLGRGPDHIGTFSCVCLQLYAD